MTFKTDNPLPGDIGLIHISGPVGGAISLGQRIIGSGSYYTHAFIVGRYGDAYQAQPGGAIVLTLADAVNGHRVAYSAFALTADQRNAIVDAAKAMLGTPYSDLDYPAIGAARLLHFRWLERYVMDTGHMICSQYADEAYRRAGVELFPNRMPGDVAPGDIAHLIGA